MLPFARAHRFRPSALVVRASTARMARGQRTLPSSNPARFRVQVRPAPGEPTRYLWTIYGTKSLFYEESGSSYASIEQALQDANDRLKQLA